MILFDDNVITVIYLDLVYTYLLNISPTSIVSKIIISAPEENFKKKKILRTREMKHIIIFKRSNILVILCNCLHLYIFYF